ncbi:hypothetical protein BJ508DRAFT_29537 [Ascobolus immersus RN42]|uniref:Uncharacterized protein n=1 Tax=Ascobolus immersus RN42 TaxID=1160509 RepID=A0A3N4HM64_ASCIM|nr:hypothetical protein BJ508DRAFT_29537 [Ascobolus immersus RN42]
MHISKGPFSLGVLSITTFSSTARLHLVALSRRQLVARSVCTVMPWSFLLRAIDYFSSSIRSAPSTGRSSTSFENEG